MDYQQSPYLIEIFDFQLLHMELNTPLFMLVVVLVVVYFMNRWLFRPVMRTLDNRDGLLAQLQQSAEASRGEVRRMSEQYEQDLQRVRAEVSQVRGEAHAQAQREVAEIVGQARQQGRDEHAQAMRDMEGQVEQVRAELGEQARTLAEQATNRILG